MASESAPAPPVASGVVRVLAPLAVAALTVLAFLPALSAGWQTHWDDDWNFLNNPAYRGLDAETVNWAFTTFHHGPYQPLSWLSLTLDHALWGLDPAGYHLTNVLLHAGTAVFAYFAFRALLARAAPGGRHVVAAAVAALFFAAHPLRVESVVWVTERRDVLSGLFFVPTIWLYATWTRTDLTEGRRRTAYVGAILCFAASLLAKGTGMMLPVALVILDAYPLGRLRFDGLRPRPTRAVLLDKLPFVLLALGAAAQAWRGQAVNETFVSDGTWLQKGTQALYGLAFYTGKTIAPLDLSPFYELRGLDPAVARYFVPALATVVGAALLFGWRSRAPALLAAFAVFGVLVLPVLGLAQAGLQLVADRYTYLPCLAFAPLVGHAWNRWPRVRAGIVLGLLVLGVGTYRYTTVWRTSDSLWSHTVRVHPENAQAHMQCSLVRQEQDRPVEMERHLRYYVEQAPGDADGWARLGNARAMQGALPEAITLWEKALRIDPTHDAARRNLAQHGR